MLEIFAQDIRSLVIWVSALFYMIIGNQCAVSVAVALCAAVAFR